MGTKEVRPARELVSVKLTPYEHGWGVKTELDGVEVQEVSDIKLECPVDGVPKLTLTINAPSPGLEVVLPAAVHVTFVVSEGLSMLDVTSSEDDGKKFLVVKTS